MGFRENRGEFLLHFLTALAAVRPPCLAFLTLTATTTNWRS